MLDKDVYCTEKKCGFREKSEVPGRIRCSIGYKIAAFTEQSTKNAFKNKSLVCRFNPFIRKIKEENAIFFVGEKIRRKEG